jgi:hypothetical protein
MQAEMQAKTPDPWDGPSAFRHPTYDACGVSDAYASSIGIADSSSSAYATSTDTSALFADPTCARASTCWYDATSRGASSFRAASARDREN